MKLKGKLEGAFVAALVFVAALPACEASAQEATDQGRVNPSILEFLPIRGSIAPNVTGTTDTIIAETLRVSDALVRAGRRVAAWSLQAEEGKSYEVALSSDDFDPFLYVVGPGIVLPYPDEYGVGEYALTDDDSGDGFNAWLCFDARQDAEYRVIASALYGNVGAFTMEVMEVEECVTAAMEGDLPSPDLAVDVAVTDRAGVDLWEGVVARDTIRVGIVYRGTFTAETMRDTDGRPLAGWLFPAEEGRRFGIAMVADGFDARVHVLSADDFQGGYGSGRGVEYGHLTDNELLCVLVPEEASDVIYRVIASAEATVEDTVSYGLIVMEDPGELLCPTIRTSAAYYRQLMMDLRVDDARTISSGDVMEGVLSENEYIDPVLGTPVQPWFLRDVFAGDSITIEVRSMEFWPDVIIRADTAAIQSQRDRCYSLFRFVLPEQEDDYRVFVRTETDSPGTTGRFMLAVSGAEAWNTPVVSCDAERAMAGGSLGSDEILRVGYEVEGQLPWGDDAEAVWRLEVEEATVVLSVESEDFDTYLTVYGPDNMEQSDDDSGVGNASRLVLDGVQAGTYYVVISSFTGDGGVYRLRATWGET